MSPLVPCPACYRHVRCADERCPFCRAALPNDLDQTLVPMPQTERGATPVLGPVLLVAMAATAMGCAGHAMLYGAPPSRPPPDAGTPNVETVAPPYGLPPPAHEPVVAPSRTPGAAPPNAASPK
ncbi:MAG: hypothetical protein IPG50_35365 [Myxococcales bacterium]|nr:hypothetical protein [Myxococcales bacterium]